MTSITPDTGGLGITGSSVGALFGPYPLARYEYPFGSGNFITQPPGSVYATQGGYRLSLANGRYTLDIPNGYDVWTTDGFVDIQSLLGKTVEVNEFRATYSFAPIPIYAPASSIAVMQTHQYSITSIEDIVEYEAKMSLPYNPQERVTPDFTYTCAGVVLGDPSCGVRYVVEVTVLLS